MRLHFKHHHFNGFQQKEMENIDEINLRDEVAELQF